MGFQTPEILSKNTRKRALGGLDARLKERVSVCESNAFGSRSGPFHPTVSRKVF
jgi:hypothetical protein